MRIKEKLSEVKMDKIKVIFLDVDGVLNSSHTVRTTVNNFIFAGSRQLKTLKRIIRETRAKVVLSSDWRYDRDDPAYNSDYLELEYELQRNGIQFYDFTPEFPTAHRGAEISKWLKAHEEVDNFVILDDQTDIEPNKDHWVQTVRSRGLGVKETEEAINILNASMKG